MTAPFPHRYWTKLTWKEGRRGTVTAPPRPELSGGPPPEFDGGDRDWSPEHLLLASVSLCLMTTFLAMAERAQIKILAYGCRTEGALDKTDAGFMFTGITHRVSLRAAPADQERAERLLQTAKKYCIVANSLKTPVALEPAVTAG